MATSIKQPRSPFGHLNASSSIVVTSIKVAQYNNLVATPFIFESLFLKQIDLYGNTIITHLLHID